METEHHRLYKILKRSGLEQLITEFDNDNDVIEVWKRRTQDQWKEIAGVAPGIDIYNDLHSPKEETQGISPVSSGKPITLEDEKHFEKLMGYIYKTKNGSCLTILDEKTAVTYCHGSHSSWKIGETIEIFPVLANNSTSIFVFVHEIHAKHDYNLLKSKTKLCDQSLVMINPKQNSKYIQVGLSGRNGAPVVYHGVIHSDKFAENKGFYLGTAGAAPGDSGSGVFSLNSLELYGICTAAMTKKFSAKESVETQLHQINLNGSYPHLSYICPSFRFEVEPPEIKRKRGYEEGDNIYYE